MSEPPPATELMAPATKATPAAMSRSTADTTAEPTSPVSRPDGEGRSVRKVPRESARGRRSLQAVIDAELPDWPTADAVTRGFAACLASVTEVPMTELPVADD